MKCKVLLIIFTLLVSSSCESTKSFSKNLLNLNEDLISPMAQSSYMTNLFTTFSEDSFYYLSNGGVLFAYDKDGTNLEIGSVNYIDDKPVGSTLDGLDSFGNYEDIGMNGEGFIYFDNKLIYESTY